ncbi:RNA polymerase sigma factor [Geomonas sp. Red276]
MDDQRIIALINDGDTRHFQNLFNRYQDRIYNLCRYMLENPQDAEDAAQDTFIKAFQGLKSYTPTSNFYTWLYRIAVNTCLDYKRKFSIYSLFFSTDNEDLIHNFPSPSPSPETSYATRQSMQTLQSALNLLSKKLRVIIILKELERLSYEEIAEVLDVSVGTVKSRISRAREELQKKMKKITEQK